jgi:hypothetical protein
MADSTKPRIEEKDKLSGLNYLTWAFLMQNLLIHSELWDIVINPPENYTAAKLKESSKALALIVFNVSTALIPILRMCTHASEAWRRLESLYAGRSEARIQHLREQLSVVALGATESISSYFARARGIWNELVTLGHHTTETDVVWSILKGLPSRFLVIVSILRASPPEGLTLDSALTQILNFEQPAATPTPDGAVTAHVAQFVKRCHYCKKPGHLIRDCRKRIAHEARNAENPNPAPVAHPATVVTSNDEAGPSNWTRRHVSEIGY